MFDRVQLVELVESAISADPFCHACGAPNQIADESGALVLRCSAAASATGVLGKIGAALLPHFHQVIAEREELLAA